MDARRRGATPLRLRRCARASKLETRSTQSTRRKQGKKSFSREFFLRDEKGFPRKAPLGIRCARTEGGSQTGKLVLALLSPCALCAPCFKLFPSFAFPSCPPALRRTVGEPWP